MHARHLPSAFLLCCTAVVAPCACAAPPGAVTEAQSDHTSNVSNDWASSIRQVNLAQEAVQKMSTDPVMTEALRLASGIFIVPSYRRAAVGLGATAGGGVMLLKRPDGRWSSPVFYTLGSLSVGLQAGAQRGPLILVLMNDKATADFTQKNNFSLSADAGLTVLNWNKVARGSVGSGDVIVWSGTKGLFGDLIAIGINDIRYNQQLTNAYYRRTLSASDVTAGQVDNVHSAALQQTLGNISSAAQ